MKPHPRIRKTVKWGGSAVTLLLAAAWLVSGWFYVAWHAERWHISAYEGRVGGGRLIAARSEEFPGLRVASVQMGDQDSTFKLQFWNWNWYNRRDQWFVMFPLWVPAVISGVGTVLAWRLDHLARRRARLNLCPKCHYDRAGLAAGTVCPECGSAPS